MMGSSPRLNESGEFNEWHHGETLEPMGVRAQAWSAGAYLFALECVKRSDVPEGFFGDRKSTRLNSSHSGESRMPSSA